MVSVGHVVTKSRKCFVKCTYRHPKGAHEDSVQTLEHLYDQSCETGRGREVACMRPMKASAT